MCVKLWHAKISVIYNVICKGNIFKLGVEWKGAENICVFQRKTGHISETVKDTAKVTINH